MREVEETGIDHSFKKSHQSKREIGGLSGSHLSPCMEGGEFIRCL